MSRLAYRTAALACACLLLAPGAFAEEEVRVEARVDARKIGVQDLLQLTLTLEGARLSLQEEPAPPKLQNLRLAGGPSVATQLSIVNGAMTSSRTYTWVLQPTGVGRAEIGPLHVKLEGGERTTSPIGIEVVPGSVRPPPSRQAPEDEDPFEALRQLRRGPAPEPKLFVEAVPSRNRLHVGEPLVLTYFVYTQAPVSDLQFVEAPQFPGFWAESLDKPEREGGEAVTYQGESMQRFAILRRLLFPTKAGRLTLPPVSFKIRLPRRGFFDPGAELERATKAITIAALPLPEGPGFSGAVGHFEVDASLDRTEVSLGEAANLKVKVAGRGNLKWVEKGPQPSLGAAKVYPPQVKSEIEAGPTGLSGAKTWEFVVVPETAGTLEIPQLSFTYFDPELGRLKVAESKPLTLVVHGALGAGGPAVTAPAAPRSTGSLALRADLDPPSSLLPQLSARALSLGLGLVLALHAALWGGAVLSDRRRIAGHHAPRQSVRQALAELSKAERSGLTKEAAAASIEKAIHDVFGPVDEGGAPQGEREQAAVAVLQEAQFIRYAPQLGDYSEKIREVAARAAEVIRSWA